MINTHSRSRDLPSPHHGGRQESFVRFKRTTTKNGKKKVHWVAGFHGLTGRERKDAAANAEKFSLPVRQ